MSLWLNYTPVFNLITIKLLCPLCLCIDAIGFLLKAFGFLVLLVMLKAFDHALDALGVRMDCIYGYIL